MKYTDKLGLPVWNKPETDVFDIEQFNEGMQAIDDIVIHILNQIDDLVIGDKEIDLNGYVKEKLFRELKKKVENKADKEKVEEISSQLDTKANKSDVETTNKKITNDIEAINSELDGKASQMDLEAQRARIDSFTSLAPGSTTGDAELIDARIGIDGTTYKNAGTAVREQLKHRTGFVIEVEQYLKEANRKNGYYYHRDAPDENKYVASDGSSIYNKIMLKKGVTYHDYTADGDGNYVLRASNNSTGTYTAVSTSVSKNTKIMKRRSQGWIYNSDGSQITQCIVLTVYK